jgi:hypothetical protein
MVTLHRAATWKIAVYGREHGVPHFHVEGRGFRCSVTIESQELIIGVAPPAILQDACAWAREHRADLMVRWRELNE